MESYNLGKLNFLVVDDNRHMRALLRTVLRALGGRNIEEAGDGAEAFKTLATFPADIIICDWHMAPMDGMDFVRLVRTDKGSPNPFVPIIMLSAYTEAKRVVEARDVGVTEFLAKPISAHQLYSRIQSVIEHPRPFIRAESYYGPDRRRRKDPNYGGPGRRKEDAEKDENAEEEGDGLSEDQVHGLLEE